MRIYKSVKLSELSSSDNVKKLIEEYREFYGNAIPPLPLKRYVMGKYHADDLLRIELQSLCEMLQSIQIDYIILD